jgi:dTDP-4-amino-4,6-dideoxygalactose transaminase
MKERSKIPLFKVHMSENAINRVTEVLRSGFIGQGPVVEEFEKELGEYFGPHVYPLTTNSATSAEHLALHLLKKPNQDVGEDYWPGLEPGDEILTTPLTCTATNWPILANGFKIKWVDVDPETLNMDLDDLARKITPKTKVIIVVHWGGYPINLEKLAEIQWKAYKTYGFLPKVIEDCAHAMGSRYVQPIGQHGNICTFSLQAIKHVTAGDGGILVVPTKDLYERAKKLRWYGIDRESPRRDFRCEPDIEEWGFKFHMNDINAAIGLENFKEKEWIIKRHQENAAFYDEQLKDVDGVKLLRREQRYQSSFWIYSLLVEHVEHFQKHMEERGIATSQVHQRNDIHSCVNEYKSILPNLDKITGFTGPYGITSIPVGWWVSDEDRQYIVDCIKQGW